MKPVFYMTIGLPASGKTVWAESRVKEGVRHHSSDAIRLEGPDAESISNSKVFEVLGNRVREDLKNGRSAIYDATCLNRRRRISFLETLKKIDCEKTAVLFLTPLNVCRERNRLRTGMARVPEETYLKMLRAFELPDACEGFDRVEYVLYDGQYDPACKEITVPFRENNGGIVFKKLGFDSLGPECLLDFSQDNPHHEHTLGVHMKMVGELMERKLEGGVPGLTGSDADISFRRRCLLNAAYHHDIGKVFTKTFKNMRGMDTETAHFYGHENCGAYLYLTEKKDPSGEAFSEVDPSSLNMNTNKPGDGFREILYTALLINWHMKPLNTWENSDKSRRSDKELLDKTHPHLYEDIMLLHECDIEAH